MALQGLDDFEIIRETYCIGGVVQLVFYLNLQDLQAPWSVMEYHLFTPCFFDLQQTEEKA